jgi:two-component system response regulator HydG
VRLNVRLVAATNQDLGRLVEQKRFRPDLFYRVNVLPLRVPPLRERPQDIPLLAAHLLPPGRTLRADALARLASHSWPGNVRELRNVLERAAVVAAEQAIQARDLKL